MRGKWLGVSLTLSGLLLSQGGCAALVPSSVACGEAAFPCQAGAADLPQPADPKPEPAAGDAKTELTLTAAIQTALFANPDLHSAVERVALAGAVLDRARADFYPRLGISEDYGVSDNPQTAFAYTLSQGRFTFVNNNLNHAPVEDDFHTQLHLQQALYTGGRRLAEERAAEARHEAELYGLAGVQNELVFRVAEAYYRLLQARELVKVRGEAVEQVQRELEIVRARVRAGTAVRSDELAVEVRRAEVEEIAITARNQLELAWAVLENVLGTHVSPHLLPADVPAAPWSQHELGLEAILAEASQTRPEMGELTSRQRAADQAIRSAQAARYPAVDLVSDYDYHTQDFRGGNESFFLGLGVRLTLFDAGRTASDIRQAKARLGELAARHQRQALDIELEVRRAYLQLLDAQERFRVATRAVGQAEESLREYEARYRAQRATLTQVLDAQLALSNARVRRANVAADIEIARAALERAVGRFARFTGT
jgi:outer membrane protein TolC